MAALGLTGRPWPDAVVVTFGVILADLASRPYLPVIM
jgi:hypothetical protein